MNSRFLTIAAAIVLISGVSVGSALAQNTDEGAAPPGPAMEAPAGGDAGAAPMAPEAAPAPAPAPAAAKEPAEGGANPYGLGQLWAQGDFVAKSVLILLIIMSAGTWYIFFMKYFEQSRILNQARIVEKKFWASGTLQEGLDKLPKGSMFRAIGEAGQKAASGGTSLVSLNDWIAMSLSRQLEDATSRLQGGIAFLASVGSTSPFVGLFGTVWGIEHALIAIGVAGQASIDKVAGPVGEALIMTAIGLAVAVPAVLLYNYLVRRNKIITEKLRAFSGDLQTYLITKAK